MSQGDAAEAHSHGDAAADDVNHAQIQYVHELAVDFVVIIKNKKQRLQDELRDATTITKKVRTRAGCPGKAVLFIHCYALQAALERKIMRCIIELIEIECALSENDGHQLLRSFKRCRDEYEVEYDPEYDV